MSLESWTWLLLMQQGTTLPTPCHSPFTTASIFLVNLSYLEHVLIATNFPAVPGALSRVNQL